LADAPEPSDEEIVRRIRDGDGAAATILFDRHRDTLHAAAERGLRPALRGKVGASDIVQDAYLAAFLDLADFEDRGDGSFARWLRQILEHKILNEVRRHAGVAKRDARREVRLATGTGGAAGTPTSGDPSPSAAVAAAEQTAAVRGAIDDLPDDYRTVIRLVHEDGLTLVDAGVRMGRSADAARKLYGRALERMADRLVPPGSASL
jgi:RNA polymerase sigma-70 factor (ECF subfamily)